jgi:hypothetical protein
MKSRENIQFQIPNFKFQILFVLVLGIMLFVSPVSAATASPSASPQATSSASLLQKINQIKETAASKAADFISTVTKKLQNKAYFGQISSINGDEITVSFQNGDKKILTTEYTVYSSTLKSTKKITSIDDFKEGEFVSGLGDADDKGVLKAKKLVKSSPIASDSSKLVWGTITRAQSGTIWVKLADTTDQTITASGQTKVFLGQEEGSLLDMKSGKTIVARGKESKDRIISATYIYVVPNSVNDKPQKKPEPSFSASPSATPKKR